MKRKLIGFELYDDSAQDRFKGTGLYKTRESAERRLSRMDTDPQTAAERLHFVRVLPVWYRPPG